MDFTIIYRAHAILQNGVIKRPFGDPWGVNSFSAALMIVGVVDFPWLKSPCVSVRICLSGR
jgi:hypothetical protein